MLTDLEHRYLASTGGVRVGVVCAVSMSMRALLLPQIQAFQRAGYEVCGICSDGPEIPSLRALGVPIFPLEILREVAPFRDLKALLQMTRLLRKLRLDIVHMHTPKAMVVGMLGSILAKVPIRIITVHGFYFVNERSRLRRLFFKTLSITACRCANFVFSQSQEDLDMVWRENLLLPERVQYLGNGINLERFRRENYPADEGLRVRAQCGIPPDAYVVGIVARLTRGKGFNELFEALGSLRNKIPNIHLLHIGPIDSSRGSKERPEMAAEFGVQDICHFLGYREDVPRLMTAMDMLCLPSHREGFPRSVIEACAMSLPPVVTDIRGSREAISHGQTGLVVPLGDVPALADAIEQLYRDPDLRQTLGQAARQQAEEAFDERRVFRAILWVYEQQLWRLNRTVPKSLPAPRRHA